MLWLFPIEPIELRYSVQWARWWPQELDRLGVAHTVVLGRAVPRDVGRGQFLDPVATHAWKATQLVAFLEHVQRGDVRDGDWVMLHDAWNPMLESLAYVRDTEGPRFKIAGLFHAGTYDRHDYLAQCGLGRWARSSERGWLKALDRAFVATRFHQSLLGGGFVTGFPLYARDFVHHAVPWAARPRRVVFPHRLAPEKQPDAFARLEREYRAAFPSDDVEFVTTATACSTKEDYYACLGSARVVVSAARQETWGIAMLEGLALGAHPIAPARLSYRETMPPDALYAGRGDPSLVQRVRERLDRTKSAAYDGVRWERAIERMVRQLGCI